jgi:hypothetical protein
MAWTRRLAEIGVAFVVGGWGVYYGVPTATRFRERQREAKNFDARQQGQLLNPASLPAIAEWPTRQRTVTCFLGRDMIWVCPNPEDSTLVQDYRRRRKEGQFYEDYSFSVSDHCFRSRNNWLSVKTENANEKPRTLTHANKDNSSIPPAGAR